MTLRFFFFLGLVRTGNDQVQLIDFKMIEVGSGSEGQGGQGSWVVGGPVAASRRKGRHGVSHARARRFGLLGFRREQLGEEYRGIPVLGNCGAGSARGYLDRSDSLLGRSR